MRTINDIIRTAERASRFVFQLVDHGEDGCLFRFDGLTVIASNGGGWDHVSVSMPDRTPTWDQMQSVRRVCFLDDEWVVQYSPPLADHINVHPHCLHMWRFQHGDPPTPPKWMIA